MEFDQNKKMKVGSLQTKITEYDNGMVIFLEPEKQLWVRTSATGLWIYKYLEKNPCSFLELLKTVAEYNNLPLNIIEEDIKQFINDMLICGFIILEDELVYKKDFNKIKKLTDFSLNELWIDITSDYDEFYSFNPNVKKEKEFFPLDKIEDLLHQAKLMEVKFLTISGGEPLMHPQFSQILSKARSISDWEIKVRTSANFESWDHVDMMIKYADIIELVMVGIKEDTHDKIRGEGNFRKIIELLRHLKQHKDRAKKRIGILFIPLKDNIDEMKLLLEMGYSNRLDFVHINHIKLSEYYLKMDENERNEFFQAAYDAFKYLLAKNTFELIKMKPNDAKKLKINENFAPYYDFLESVKKCNCEAGITKLCVIENGDVFPCLNMKVFTDARIGNCFKGENLSALYQKARNWNQHIFSVDYCKKCKDCDYRYYCGGGCRVRVQSLNEPDLMCDMIIQIYNDFFKRMEFVSYNEEKEEVMENDIKKQRFYFKHCN